MTSHPEHRRERAFMASFLRSRRQALTPEDVGLTASTPRDEPGLTRDEVAQLAGISVAYLARLEQGISTRASPSALDGLARALILDADDREHLFRLVETIPATRRHEPPVEHVALGMTRLLNALTDIPAVVLGSRDDILAWNRLGHRLLAPHVPYEAPLAVESRPNRVKMIFLDSRIRRSYRDWEVEACRAVTQLHELAALRPDDLALMRLVGDLVVASDEFARLWADPQPPEAARGMRHLLHPEVGELHLNYEILSVEGNEQRLLIHCAERGSLSEARLHEMTRLLASS